MSLRKVQSYPNSKVKILPGDILYSSIGKSTYYVGHVTIVGPDCNIIESIPGNPSGHILTASQFWQRHHTGDRITLLRSKFGAEKAAQWALENVQFVKKYTVLNYQLKTIENNYCSKFILQAYYYGANYKLTPFLNWLILPQAFKYMQSLEKVAIFIKT